MNKKTQFTRRKLLQSGLTSAAGLSLLPSTAQAESETFDQSKATAKSVIYIHVDGGLSHVDSFDIKEANKDAMRASEPINTSADGIRIGRYFPKLAKQMHHCAIINSMSNTQGAHKEANYLLNTGYEQRGTTLHPDLGAWIARMAPRTSGEIPPFVKIGRSSSLGAGFMGSKYAALPVGNPQQGLKNIKLPRDVNQDLFHRRLGLMNSINAGFAQKHKHKLIDDYKQSYYDAIKLMHSKDLEVFNIKKENKSTFEMYGDEEFGQSCILARRLVEKGVRFISLAHKGWDFHYGIYDEFDEYANSLDQGVAALIADLEDRGLLESTLVVVNTEFGRNPALNDRAGRNHYPIAYSSFLAGGGIIGGQKYGKTDELGKKVVSGKVRVSDFNATIANAVGLNLKHVVMNSDGRPFTVGDKGKPLTQLFKKA